MNGPAAVLFDINGAPLTTLSDGSLLVTIADGYVTLASSSISISNFPASQTVDGTVSISGTTAVSGTVAVSNFPAFPATQAVSRSGAWAVSINNFPATQPVSGTIAVSNFPAIQTVNVNDFPAIQAVSQSGSWSVTTDKSSTSTVAAVAPSTSNVVLLAANANRVFAHVSNSNSKSLFIKLGATASLVSYTDVVLSGNAYDVPVDYVGIVSGIWAAGPNGGSALVTELLP